MEPITEQQERQIDNSPAIYGEVIFKKTPDNIIIGKDIYMYGVVDFSKDDINIIQKLNLINRDKGSWIYSDFKFGVDSIDYIGLRPKGYYTDDSVEWFQFCYTLIGKPERLIIYRKPVK